jgi:hypothetical protein
LSGGDVEDVAVEDGAVVGGAVVSAAGDRFLRSPSIAFGHFVNLEKM